MVCSQNNLRTPAYQLSTSHHKPWWPVPNQQKSLSYKPSIKSLPTIDFKRNRNRGLLDVGCQLDHVTPPLHLSLGVTTRTATWRHQRRPQQKSCNVHDKKRNRVANKCVWMAHLRMDMNLVMKGSSPVIASLLLLCSLDYRITPSAGNWSFRRIVSEYLTTSSLVSCQSEIQKTSKGLPHHFCSQQSCVAETTKAPAFVTMHSPISEVSSHKVFESGTCSFPVPPFPQESKVYSLRSPFFSAVDFSILIIKSSTLSTCPRLQRPGKWSLQTRMNLVSSKIRWKHESTNKMVSKSTMQKYVVGQPSQ